MTTGIVWKSGRNRRSTIERCSVCGCIISGEAQLYGVCEHCFRTEPQVKQRVRGNLVDLAASAMEKASRPVY